LLPALAGAKEKGRRAACKNNQRQFILGVHLFANDNTNRVPSGLSENFNAQDEHTPVISTATRKALIDFAGSSRVLECPGLMRPFNTDAGWYYGEYGFVIGYNYLGGHVGTPWPSGAGYSNWVSPQTLNDSPSLVLIAELNDWAPGYGKAFAPHTANGPLIRDDDLGTSANGATSKQIGAVGGNIGLLDGSVQWRNIRGMKLRLGSRVWGDQGCLAEW
jgi:hypothetical protein